MKTLKTAVLALGAVALAATGLQAQTAVATIPFEFTAQNVTLPAGQYALASLNDRSSVITIRNLDTGKATAVLALPADWKKSDGAKIVFHTYGDRYFLSEVRTPSGPKARMMPSRSERELQARGGEVQMASLSIPLSAQ